jgi:3'-phosphoadenosine 5'-phosphosulfate sulfotransferase (PAPS reductase)/FAD synthetase
MFSGGVGSWAAAKRVAETHGTSDLTLLFTDTRMEDEDLYRFIDQAAANVGGTFVRLADGRSVWELFFEERMMGNTKADLCSRILKRELADKYLADHYSPEDTTVHVGIDWTESHRIDRLSELRKPWRYEAPLCSAPYLTKAGMIEWLQREGIAPPGSMRWGSRTTTAVGFA